MERMHPEDLRELARLIAEEMRAASAPAIAGGLVDANTLAAAIGVKRSYVYDHREELGGIEIGGGSRPRLRFDVERARAALEGAPEPAPQPARTRRRQRRSLDEHPLSSGRGSLLPIHRDQE